MKKSPLVSIITATYNAEKLIEQTINSVSNQLYAHIEYIIIDGGSTDGTLSVIEKYKNVISYYVSEKDDGIYDAWNKGIKKATGEWIAFLGAGDEYLPDALTNYIDYINSSATEFDFVSSKVSVISSKGHQLYLIGTGFEWPRYLDFMNIAHVGSLHSKHLFTKYGVYNSEYKIIGDYELLLRAGPNLEAGFTNVVTAKMLFGGMSISKQSLKEAYKAKLGSGYLSKKKAAMRYYASLFKASVRFFLFKMGVFVSIRK